jgi:hypothetical protein
LEKTPKINTKSHKSNQEVRLEFKEMEKRKYNLLKRRQIKAKTEAWERLVEGYRKLQREMCEKKLAPNLPYVKAFLLGWFEPLEGWDRERVEGAADEEAEGGVCECCFKASQMLGVFDIHRIIFCSV